MYVGFGFADTLLSIKIPSKRSSLTGPSMNYTVENETKTPFRLKSQAIQTQLVSCLCSFQFYATFIVDHLPLDVDNERVTILINPPLVMTDGRWRTMVSSSKRKEEVICIRLLQRRRVLVGVYLSPFERAAMEMRKLLVKLE